MVKSPPSNAGDTGSIPGRGTKIPHAVGQLSPSATTAEHMPQLESPHATTTEPMHSGARTPQLERENPHTTTREKPVHCDKEPVRHNKGSHILQRRSHVPQLRPDVAK